jgi:hypothetical protein
MSKGPSLAETAPLLLGDTLTYAFVTLLGFATHGLLTISPAWRFLATFLPFLGAWILAALAVGAFDTTVFTSPRQLWRPAIAALLAAPLGAVVRGAWLGAPVLPIFVLIMGVVSIAAILAWRGLYLGVRRRPARS